MSHYWDRVVQSYSSGVLVHRAEWLASLIVLLTVVYGMMKAAGRADADLSRPLHDKVIDQEVETNHGE